MWAGQEGPSPTRSGQVLRPYNQHEKGADGVVRACELVERAACWCPRPVTALQKSLLLKWLSTGDALKRAPTLPRAGHALPPQSFLRGQKDLQSVEELDIGQFGGDVDALKAALGTAAPAERQQILIGKMRGEFV
jgi:hypothetical protein